MKLFALVILVGLVAVVGAVQYSVHHGKPVPIISPTPTMNLYPTTGGLPSYDIAVVSPDRMP